MQQRLKERLIGAVVLVMLAVIFIPMILDDTTQTNSVITETNIPTQPEVEFTSRIISIQAADTKKTTGVDRIEKTNIKKEIKEELALNKERPKIKIPLNLQTESTVARKANTVGITAWVVQLGSFTREVNATALNKKLRKAGYPAFVEPVRKETGMRYRVRVGPELIKEDAQALLIKLQETMQIKGMVIHYP